MIDKQRQLAQTVDRLLQERIILLSGELDDEAAHLALAQLLFLLDRDGKEPVSIYIDSHGGSVTAPFAILDLIDDATAPIHTTCVGVASGTALLVLGHGENGSRSGLPHAQFQMTKLRVADSNLFPGEVMRGELQRLEDLIVS